MQTSLWNLELNNCGQTAAFCEILCIHKYGRNVYKESKNTINTFNILGMVYGFIAPN